ncbi:MAG: aminoacyl-tRNA hydrolase, partial [Deltaproteobacteria bacterium]|nr:aminoacyl-tRNA hydrolase [Deltaproteobacteria bacterium]
MEPSDKHGVPPEQPQRSDQTLFVTRAIHIPLREIRFAFIRASGPGGQHVNRSATAVQLRFDVENSPSLTAEVKKRLGQLAGSRISKEGILIIEAQEHRSSGDLELLEFRVLLLERPLGERPVPDGRVRELLLAERGGRGRLRHGIDIEQDELARLGGTVGVAEVRVPGDAVRVLVGVAAVSATAASRPAAGSATGPAASPARSSLRESVRGERQGQRDDDGGGEGSTHGRFLLDVHQYRHLRRPGVALLDSA